MEPPDPWRGADLVLFDCDSTLSRIEGVDELAAFAGVDVSAMTAQAMEGELPLDAVFGARLDRIRPSTADLSRLADRYWDERVEGAAEVVAQLQAAGSICCVVSGGLLPAVSPFAQRLGFSPDSIFAVPFAPPSEDADDAAWAAAIHASCEHPLAQVGGKPQVIEALAAELAIPRERRLLVGDGASDLEAANSVGLFVGFGGVVERPAVKAAAGEFLPGPSLAMLAPLALGPERRTPLSQEPAP